MANDIPSILHHVSVGTDNLERACAFYDSVMPHLGASRMMSFPFAVAYGMFRFRSGASPSAGTDSYAVTSTYAEFVDG